MQIDRRTPRALLYYLAAQGKAVSRAEVMLMFWNDQPEKKTRQRLREVISRLRNQLPAPGLLISNPNQLSLDLSRVEIDQVQFETLLRQAGQLPWQIAPHEPLPPRTYELLNQAVGLWRGPGYLANADLPATPEIKHWLQETALHVEALCSSSILRLAQHELLVRNFSQALRMARNGLEINPVNDDLISLMMQILVRMGLYHEAEQLFENNKDRLQSEALAVPAQMEELYQLIQLETDLPRPEEIDWGLHPSIQVPFVGRQALLETIKTRLEQHQCIFLTGPTGAGKTRLMREIAIQMHPQPRLFVVRCRSMDQAQPYQPFIDIFRKAVPHQEWSQLSYAWGQQIHTLLPEISDYRAELALPVVADTTYFGNMLLESIRQVFLLLARQRPLLLVVDDLQWADESSLAALEYLLSRPPFDQRAHLMLAARNEGLSPALKATMKAIQVSHLASTYAVSELTPEDITQLSKHVFQVSPPEYFVEKLAQNTGGNPLFVLESLRVMLEQEPEKYFQPDTSLPLTPSLQGMLWQQIANLDPVLQQVLTVAAAMEGDIHPEVLARASQLTSQPVVGVLHQLEKLNLLAPTEHSRRLRYQFPNETVREAIQANTPVANLQAIHRRISTAYQETRQMPSDTVLARHFELGGQLEQSFEYWIRAARHARSVFAKQDAQQNFVQAKTLLDQIGASLPDEALYSLYAPWAEMCYELNQGQQVRQLGLELIEFGRQRNSSLLLGTGLDILGDASLLERKFAEALEHVNQALPYLEQAGHVFELAEAYLHRGYLLYLLWQFDAAMEALQSSLRHSYQADEIVVLGARSYAHAQLAIVLSMQGQPGPAREQAYKALQTAEISKRFYQLVMARMMICFSSHYLADNQQMLAQAWQSVNTARRMSALRLLCYALNYLATAEITLGQLDAAYEHVREALAIAEQTGQRDAIAMSCRQLGDLFRLLMQYPQANNYYRRGHMAAPEHFTGMENAYRQGLMNVYLGQIMPGLQQLEQAYQRYLDLKLYSSAFGTRICQLLAWLETEQSPTYLEQLESLREAFARRGIQRYLVELTLIEADLAERSGDCQAASLHYRRAMQQAKEAGNLWQELKAVIQLERNPFLNAPQRVAIKERSNELLAQLESQTQHPDLQASFASFRNQLGAPSCPRLTCL
ncbi:MAG: AAA family ATPase [Anaerolineales bacterium]|nr:AAA family ATPase [Anaerolineales bacterium]